MNRNPRLRIDADQRLIRASGIAQLALTPASTAQLADRVATIAAQLRQRQRATV